MSSITSKVCATIGALGIVACASPLAAQTWHHRGRVLRYEAVWLERSQAAARGPARWYGPVPPGRVAVVTGAPWLRPWMYWVRPIGPRRGFVLVRPRAVPWTVRPWRGGGWRPALRRGI